MAARTARLHLRVHAGHEVFLGHAQLHSLDRSGQGPGRSPGTGLGALVESAGVVAGHGLEHQGRVGHGLGEGAGLVQGAGKGDDARSG